MKGSGSTANEKLEEVTMFTKSEAWDEMVVDVSNYLPVSRADGTVGKPMYDFNDGKDNGNRDRVKLANKGLDITETDEILSNMKKEIQYAEDKANYEARAKALEETQNAINEAMLNSLGANKESNEA